MSILVDTHFLLWILTDSERLREFSWIERHRPWLVSPISLLELQYLAEAGRIELDSSRLVEALGSDPRFAVDEPPLLPLVDSAMRLRWTRDPFDRLLAAHSTVRRLPFCTLDRVIRDHHPLLPEELG